MKHSDKASVSDATVEGRYVNFFKIGHNADVFVIDYFQLFPEGAKSMKAGTLQGEPKTRVIASPADVKQFHEQLKQAIKKYEQKFGQIEQDEC